MGTPHPHYERQVSGYVEAKNVALVGGSAMRYSPLRMEVRYHNETGEQVTFIDRRGVPYSVPSMRFVEDLIRIQFIYEFDADVTPDISGEYCRTPSFNDEIKALKEIVSHVKEDPFKPGKRIYTLEYRFSAEQIRILGGSIYVPEIDLVINVGVMDRSRPLHPFSLPDVRRELVQGDMDVSSRQKWAASVYIVSNDQSIDGKYINVFGEVFYVPVIVSQTMKNGLYVVKQSNNGKYTQGEPVTQVFTLEEMEGLEWVYKTREEAKHKAHSDVKAELELSQTKLEIKRVEQTNEKEKNELSTTNAQEKLKLDREMRLREREAIDRKEAYEIRSAARKDTSESIKAAPIVVGGILGLVGLYFKFKS